VSSILPVPGNTIENGDPPSEFDDIDIAEEELIDAYVRNQLSVEERKLLEKGLRSSPDLVNRLHFARLLTGAADRAAEDEVFSYQEPEELLPSRKKWWQFGLTWEQRPTVNLAFAACSLIFVIGGEACWPVGSAYVANHNNWPNSRQRSNDKSWNWKSQMLKNAQPQIKSGPN
jgi:hypothetical protein